MFKQSKIQLLRDSISKITQILSEKDMRVTQIGTKAYVERDKLGNPTCVNLPYIPDDADDGLLKAMQGFVDHEVSHILFSDASVAQKAKAQGKKIENLYGFFNDSHAESEMRKAFRGSNRNLTELASLYTDRRLAKRWDEMKESGASEKELLGSMMGAVTRAWSGDPFYEDFMSDKWDSMSNVLDKVPQSFIDSVKSIDSSTDAFDRTQQFLKYIESEDESEGDGDDDEQGMGAGDGDGDNDSDSDGDGDGDEESMGVGMGAGDGDDDGDGDEKGEGDINSDQGGANNSDDSDEEGDDESGSSSVGGQPSFGDDEDFTNAMNDASEEGLEDTLNKEIDRALSDVDDTYIPLTTEFDTFEPAPLLRDVDGIHDDDYESERMKRLHQEAVIDVGAASKKLEKAFISQNRTFFEPGKRSGRLNPSSLHRLKSGDTRVFRKKVDIRAKNTAVSLVIDQSGSMGWDNKIEKAAVAAYAFSEVLNRIKIPFETIGFTTGTYPGGYSGPDSFYQKRLEYIEEFREQTGRYSFSRDDVMKLFSYKTFEERFEYRQKSRLAVPYSRRADMGANIDGESIMFAASRLAKRKEERKCMIVLSDGQPAAGGDQDHLHTNLKDTVKRIEQAGIDVVGIGICDSAVKQYYSRHIVMNESSELTSRVISELARMLIQSA